MIRGEDKERNPFIDLQSGSIVIASAALTLPHLTLFVFMKALAFICGFAREVKQKQE